MSPAEFPKQAGNVKLERDFQAASAALETWVLIPKALASSFLHKIDKNIFLDGGL